MTIDESIGLEDPRENSDSNPQSGIDDEARERKARKDGEAVTDQGAERDLTREDIESGNDRNVSADERGRSGKTNKLDDPGIEIN